MRRTLFILFVTVMTVVGISIACSISNGSNIDEREKNWTEQISGSLKLGDTREVLEAFTKTHGQRLNCYQNYKKEDQCDFDDNQSRGGTTNRPVQLAVIFIIKNNKVFSHQFTTTLTPPNQSQ